MNVLGFQDWLRAALQAHPHIAAVTTFQDDDVALYAGLTVTTTSGTTVRAHLLRGSGPNDSRERHPRHEANVARLDGRAPAGLAPIGDDVAVKAERLLDRVILTGRPPGLLTVMDRHDFANAHRKTARARRSPQAEAGLVVTFLDGSEIHIHLYG